MWSRSCRARVSPAPTYSPPGRSSRGCGGCCRTTRRRSRCAAPLPPASPRWWPPVTTPARPALARFVRWLHDRADAAGAEVGFRVAIGDVVVSGSADRLEVDDQGRLRIVDFKTSRTVKGRADVEKDPQLGVYQLAVRAGA